MGPSDRARPAGSAAGVPAFPVPAGRRDEAEGGQDVPVPLARCWDGGGEEDEGSELWEVE